MKPTSRTLFALILMTAACTATGEAADTAAAPDAPAEPTTVEVVASDYRFELPDSVKAGTTIQFRNESSAEVHEFVAIRLPDDETRSVAELMQLPPEELAAFFPMVKTVLVAPPGATGIAVEGDGTLSEPGRYAIICVIPTGADPDEYMTAAAEAEGGPPEVAGGPPHIVEGMFAELVVAD